MLSAFRIVKEKYADTAFDGEGSRRYGGRWNNVKVPLVYTSSSLSLAVLETVVHLNPPIFFTFVSLKIEFSPLLVETLEKEYLATDWRQEPPSVSTKQFGDRWHKEKRSAILQVPSVIIPLEHNYLLNPDHPDYRKIIIHAPEPFVFDSRLFALKT
ncbi:MAG: RES family NAD+ phosphorylase [Verrucomicrobiales bacterium]